MQNLSRYNHEINFFFRCRHSKWLCLSAAFERERTASERKNAWQRIKEALCARKHSSTEVTKPKFCRPNSKTEPKPEKIWVDKGQEVAGEPYQFCRDNDIDFYSTHTETKSAFDERNIRHLKAKIFKFLHKSNTHTYIEKSQQFVNTINGRVIGSTELAPKDFEKSNVRYLISLQFCKQNRESKYKIVQQVTIKQKFVTFWKVMPHSVCRGGFHEFRTSNTEPSHIHHQTRQQSVNSRQILWTRIDPLWKTASFKFF